MTQRTTKVFTATGTFQALYRAQRWLTANGFSYGSSCAGMPTGILLGDFVIAKWRNLSAAERSECHGTMTGEMRDGPVTITLRVPFIETVTVEQVAAEFARVLQNADGRG